LSYLCGWVAGMESSRLLTCLAADYGRLREVAARDLTASVPSCPGWVVSDLVRHVAAVYLHKVECIRLRRAPDPWPPDFSAEEPIPLLERAYAALTAQFAEHGPTDPAHTWYEPDQTVGFWIRRMAQETVIHRIDSELALGVDSAPVPDDLAVDGIDEVLTLFLEYGSHRWTEEFGPALKEATGRAVRVATDNESWLVVANPAGVDLDTSGERTPAATVLGAPETVLRWLWARGGDDEVQISGDIGAVTELRGLLAAATV
jgi:uncharacterized protein (TIGR03083 family)